MTKLHTAAFEINDNTRLCADDVKDIGADIMAARFPSLRRLSVNSFSWEVGDVLYSVNFSDMIH
jgi:hypothetical protein